MMKSWSKLIVVALVIAMNSRSVQSASIELVAGEVILPEDIHLPNENVQLLR